MPMPLSHTENFTLTRSATRSSSATLTTISPCSVNLTALLTRLIRIWPRRSGSPISVGGRSCCDEIRNSRFFSCAFWPTIDDRLSSDVFQPEVGLLHVELAGFDLGEVQNVVEDAEQRLGGGLDLGEIVVLLGRELGLERQVSQPDHRVHRRADLVAHVGEEVRLGARRRLGHLLGAAHLVLGPLALGDVLDVHDHHLAVKIFGQSKPSLPRRSVGHPVPYAASPRSTRLFHAVQTANAASFSGLKSAFRSSNVHRQQFFAVESKHPARRLVRIFNPAVRRPHPEDRFGRVVHRILRETAAASRPPCAG